MKIRPDIIQYHDYNLRGIVLNYTLKAKIILTAHDVGIPKQYLKTYDKIFAISEAVKNDIWQRSGVAAITILNGIPCSAIDVKTDYSFDLFKIVQVSRLEHTKKGQDVLIKAVHELVYHKKITQIHVDFIGDGTSLAYLQNMVHNLDLDDYITFLGNRQRTYVYKNLKNYNLLLQPSLYEGFGLTVVEGVAAGLPVLVSNIEGPKEIIEKLQWGIVFEKGDALDCALRIKDIMEKYGTVTKPEKMHVARNKCIHYYDVIDTAHNYLQEYNNMLVRRD